MYLIITLPTYLDTWVKQVLSLNPFAVFISLVRVAFMSSYRTNSAGNQPFNANLCQTFLNDPGGKHAVTGGHLVPNTGLQAYCHAIVTNNDLWIAGLGWGVGIFVVGLIFFWRAENKYGRG